MKRMFALLVIALILIGSVQMINPLDKMQSRDTHQFLESSNSHHIEQGVLPNVDAKELSSDSLGYLTHRYFYRGFNDTDSDLLYNTLLIDVEVNITQISMYGGYAVSIDLHDDNYVRKVDDEFGFHLEKGIDVQVGSTPQNYSIGLHNLTIAVNCTQLRILKMIGPYTIRHVELVEWASPNWMIDEQVVYEGYIFQVPGLYDIYSFDPPNDSSEMVLSNAGLMGDTLQIDFSFSTFIHNSGSVEDYYCHIRLTNATGTTIVEHEEFFNLSSATLYDLSLTIPSEYLYGFYQHGGFESSTPSIRFQEVTIVQVSGYYEWNNIYNVSYLSEAFPTYTIDVTQAATIDIVQDTFSFGLLNEGNQRNFLIYPDSLDSILHMQINRTEPLDQWTPSYEITFINGWGRWIDPWNMGSPTGYVMWNNWEMNTEIANILSPLGKNLGPWKVAVRYPVDPNGPFPASELNVKIRLILDSTPPQINYITPQPGDNFQQHYGIPFKGSVVDQTIVTHFSVYKGSELLFTYNPIETMGWGGLYQLSEFAFVWYPPENLVGTIELTVEARDLAFNLLTSIFSVSIQPGVPPVPDSTINKGLDWLREQQIRNNPSDWKYGSWEYYPGDSSAGMTALAILCFLQAGLVADPAVTAGIQYLREAFVKDDNPSVPGKVIQRSGHLSYETAMATIALIAYNATLANFDSSVSDLIDDAVIWLVATQNDETWGVTSDKPWYGGWRYGNDHESSDLSVSQWVILALASYGYDDPNFWEKVRLFVERCRGGYWDDYTGEFIADGGFTYTPSTQDWRDQGGGSYGSMTAAGIWGLYLSGLDPTNTYIISALDWIGSLTLDTLVGQNPHYGASFEYYWYLTASKAFLMAGREQDQWWFDAITHYLNTHMIAESPTSAYWSGNGFDEPPIFATVQAILAQQVLYGEIPTDTLEISVESIDGAVLYVWNKTLEIGFNYSTGLEESNGAFYSGLMADIQQVVIESPSKGEYYVDVFPTTDEAGQLGTQQLTLRARALTETGHILRYKTQIINYISSNPYPQVFRYKLIISTVSGIDIHFIPEMSPIFPHKIRATSVSAPDFVNIGETITIDFSLNNLGIGTISSGIIFTISDLSVAYPTLNYVDWTQGITQQLSFNYETSGVMAGKQTILIVSSGKDVNPLIIRLEIQVGNRVPEGSLNTIPSIITGTYSISWSASDPDGDSLTFTIILVRPDGSENIVASDLTSTTFSFDSTMYPDGKNYKFKISISDGIDTIYLVSAFFEIDNVTGNGGLTPGFEFVLAIWALVTILICFRRRR